MSAVVTHRPGAEPTRRDPAWRSGAMSAADLASDGGRAKALMAEFGDGDAFVAGKLVIRYCGLGCVGSLSNLNLPARPWCLSSSPGVALQI